MSAARAGYVDGPFGQLHYRAEGSGRPLVLVHMAGFTGIQFAAAMPRIAAAGLRAIAVDLPGFGQSDPPPAPPTVADYATAVAALIDALALDDVVLLGTHLGAQIATDVAIARPAAVSLVVLAGPVLLTDDERTARQRFATAERDAQLHADGSHLTEMWNAAAPFFAGTTDLPALQRLITSQLAAGSRNWYGHHAAFANDHEARMRQQTQPALILSNTGDPVHTYAERARERFPQFAYRELEGGSALIADERPDEWVAAIRDFIAAN